MPDPKEILVFYEGDDDRAALERLRDAELLPKNLTLAKTAAGRGGKEPMISYLAALVASPAARSAIAIRDLDDLQPEGVGDWFVETLRQELGRTETPVNLAQQETRNKRVASFVVAVGERAGHAAVVGVGLPEARELTERWGLREFAMDDYVLRMASNQAIYGAVSELRDVSYDVAMEKLDETRKLLAENNIPVAQAKRLLHLLRGITGFRASPAEFASRLIDEGLETLGRNKLADLFQPLIDDLHAAAAALGIRSEPPPV